MMRAARGGPIAPIRFAFQVLQVRAVIVVREWEYFVQRGVQLASQPNGPRRVGLASLQEPATPPHTGLL